MSGVDPTRLREVFQAACDQPTETLSDFLQEACGDDVALQREVEILLGHDRDSSGVFGEHDVTEKRILRKSGLDLGQLRYLEPGERFGSFTIEDFLGSGGMATVYRATQEGSSRPVALKVLRAGTTSFEQLRRFHHEAEVLSRLKHPAIAEIYGSGTLGEEGCEQPYLSMELVDGFPLRTFADHRQLSISDKTSLMARICDAVHYAHERGVIHRDLKPANIMVMESGSPKVIDFGVARLTQENTLTTLHTEAGQLLGTLSYMSPEQISGAAEEVDARSDVYTLGIILYELLSGERPYDVTHKSFPDTVRIIREQEPRGLGELDSSLRGDLEIIVQQSFAKERSQRYQSAHDLADDLRRFLRDEPIRARRAGAWVHIRRFVRRHKVFSSAVAATIVSLAIGLFAAVAQMREAIDAREATSREIQRTRITASFAAVNSGDPARALELLQAVPESARRWEWSYLAAHLDQCLAIFHIQGDLIATHLVGEEPLALDTTGVVYRIKEGGPATERLDTSSRSLRMAAFSSDGSRAVTFVQEDPAELIIWREPESPGASWMPITRHPIKETPRSLAIGPTGRTVAWAGAKSVGVLELGVGIRQLSVPEAFAPRGSIALGSNTLVIGGARGQSVLVDLRAPDPKSVIIPGDHRGSILSASLSSDERFAVLGSADKRAYLIDLATRTIAQEFRGHDLGVTATAFAEDGESLITGSLDQTLRTWNIESGQCDEIRFGMQEAPDAIHAPPESATFLTRARGGELRLWKHRLDDGILQGHGSYVYAVDVAPDGLQVASASWDGSVKIWDPAAETTTLSIPLNVKRVTGCAYSPDGRRVLATSFADTWLIDAHTGSVIRKVDREKLRVHAAGWSAPDRFWLAGVGEAGSGLVRFIDASSDDVMATILCEHVIGTATITTDRSTLATGEDNGVLKVWNTERRQELLRIQAHSNSVSAVSFDPQGRRIATGSKDGTTRLWSRRTGERLLSFPDQPDSVLAIVFTSDGKRVITGCNDTKIRVFDAEEGNLLLTLEGHDDYVHSLAFAPGDRFLVSGSGDGTARIWPAVPWRELRGESGPRTIEITLESDG